VIAFRSESEEPQRGSYTRAIRDRLLSEAIGLPYFAGFKYRATAGLPIEPADLPFIGCYIGGDETMSPDGDWNAAGLKFIVNARLSWSVMVKESDREKAEYMLDGAYVALLEGLWNNPYITSVGDTTDPDLGFGTPYNARIEGVPRQAKRIQWGSPFHNNETPVAELQYEQTLLYRRTYAPGPFHDLEEVHVTTAFPAGRTPAEIEAIQQVYQRLIFTPAAPPRKVRANG
jgi:hypothetical protein